MQIAHLDFLMWPTTMFLK